MLFYPTFYYNIIYLACRYMIHIVQLINQSIIILIIIIFIILVMFVSPQVMPIDQVSYQWLRIFSKNLVNKYGSTLGFRLLTGCVHIFGWLSMCYNSPPSINISQLLEHLGESALGGLCNFINNINVYAISMAHQSLRIKWFCSKSNFLYIKIWFYNYSHSQHCIIMLHYSSIWPIITIPFPNGVHFPNHALKDQLS